MSYDIRKIMKTLEKELDSKRFEHTLGVAYTASALAMNYGCDINKARVAGLLHDCAKCISDEKKISMCEKNGLTVSDIERANPGLLHAKLGSVVAFDKYGIDDVSILEAIKWHTTGKPDMSLLEKIIFVADYIEPNRKPLPNIDMIRRFAFTDIDMAVFQILKDTLLYLGDSTKAIDPMTKDTYEFYKKGIE